MNRDSMGDDRKIPKLMFVHSELDDLPLSPNAFRVYANLIRRLGENERAWPSYNNIGRVCFAEIYRRQGREPNQATMRRMAMQAVKELEEKGLIRREQRKGADGRNLVNHYLITPPSEWRRGDGAIALGGDGAIAQPSAIASPGAIAPKGNPREGNPREGNPERESSAAQPALTPHHQEMCQAISEVCQMDLRLKGSYIGKTARQLLEAGYCPADVYEFQEWWEAADWRGVQGDVPTPANILEHILQATRSRE